VILAVKVREHDFMCEQRTPFAGGGMVFRCAADEFVLAIELADKAGRAEGGDELTACVMEKAEVGNLKPDGFFNFHAASMTWRVGQGLSKRKNGGMRITQICKPLKWFKKAVIAAISARKNVSILSLQFRFLLFYIQSGFALNWMTVNKRQWNQCK
jgi:hypothetical protein